MKLDIKSIMILVLLGASLLFGYKWWFFGSENDASKERVKQLDIEYKKLEAQKKHLDVEIANWEDKFSKSEFEIAKLQIEISSLGLKSIRAENDANTSKAGLDKIKKELDEARRNIEKLKSDNNYKTGDELLESIKNKTK